MTTRLSRWGHSCVRLDSGRAALVIDPGSFSDPAATDGAQAVLVTHAHADHVVADRVIAAMASAPDLEVWAPGGVAATLVAAGATADRVHAVAAGESFDAAGFRVETLGGEHAVVHPDLPGTENVAYLVDGAVLHPGDSFVLPDRPVRVLLAPVSGPWLKIAEVVDYVRAVRPDTVVPIHDALLSPAGMALADRHVSQLGGAGEYRRPSAGEVVELS